MINNQPVFYTHDLNNLIPRDVIVWMIEPYIGYQWCYDGNWYGNWMVMSEEASNEFVGEVIEMLMDHFESLRKNVLKFLRTKRQIAKDNLDGLLDRLDF